MCLLKVVSTNQILDTEALVVFKPLTDTASASWKDFVLVCVSEINIAFQPFLLNIYGKKKTRSDGLYFLHKILFREYFGKFGIGFEGIIYALFPLLQTAHLLFHLLNSIQGLLFSTIHSIIELYIIAFIGDRHYQAI